MHAAKVIQIGEASFDASRAELRDASGARLPLRPQTMRVLEILLSQTRRVVSRETLQAAVWPDVVVTDDSLVQCVSEIRRAIGDTSHEVLRTVARRGYLLEVPTGADDVAAAPAAAPSAAPPAAAQSATAAASRHFLLRRPATWIAGAAVVTIGVILAAVASKREPDRSATPALTAKFPARPALAVLAFRADPSDPGSAALGASMAEELIGDMARDVDLPVVSPRSSFTLDARNLSAVEIARRLQVRYLVDGSVRRDGELLQLQVQLIDGKDGRVVWNDVSHAGVADLARQRTALVNRIGGSIGSSMAWNQKQQALTRPAASLDVYALTLRGYAGKHVFTREAYAAARADLEQALRLDPQYAPALAILGYLNSADVTMRVTGEWGYERYALALAQIDRAIQLDPALPIAYQARSTTLSPMLRKAEALAAAETAVQLAPGDADNLANLARVLTQAGRLDEARPMMARALALYPIVPSYVSFWVVHLRWAERDFDAALAQCDYCLQRTPQHFGCRASRALVLFEMGRFDEARSEATAIRSQYPRADAKAVIGAFAGTPELSERRLKGAIALGFPPGD